jgi:nucleoside-diphosphate-sugar epimerase
MGVKAKAAVELERIRPASSEVERLLADNAKAARLIGWKPEFGGRDGFRRGIERTVEWFRNRQSQVAPARYAV